MSNHISTVSLNLTHAQRKVLAEVRAGSTRNEPKAIMEDELGKLDYPMDVMLVVFKKRQARSASIDRPSCSKE